MVYAIISDVHANAIALSAVLEDASSCGAKTIVCLGDVVGYGPEPESAATAIRETAAVTVAGNHDDAVSGRIDASNFIDLAADAAFRHREALSERNLSWLRSLPHIYKNGSFHCAHGDFTSPETFEYVTDESEAAANFASTLAPADFTIEDGKRYIVNPGSVGYPRAEGGICESTYVLYDDVEKTVAFRRIPFTVRSVMQTGRNPKRIKKRVFAAVICAVAAAAGAAAWISAPRERIKTVTETITNNVTKVVAIAKVDRCEDIILDTSVQKASIEVKLSKGSPAAHLQLAFKDSSGNILSEERWTVKKSRKATVKIPYGAALATLSAGRINGETPASFDRFALHAK